MTARGTSHWTGTLKEGQGTMSTQGPTVRDAPYTYASRFEGAEGAVPEELLAAAYAGCLNQAFANTFGWGNFTAESIQTTVEIEVQLGSREKIPGRIHITMAARVPGINQTQFDGLTNTAKNGCLISRLLKADATMDATLLD
jgi:lipoyl-dependent peroxiredoxin